MSKCWIIGKKVKIESNGHEYLAEPFIVFETEDQAVAACDMVEKVSLERPGITEAAFYRTGSTLDWREAGGVRCEQPFFV